jgi:hypothetical protein
VDLDKVQVKIERGKAVSLLEIDIELPCEPAPRERGRPMPRATRSRRLEISQA